MAFTICKEQSEEKKFEYLFDVFSCYSDSIKRYSFYVIVTLI